VVLVGRESCGGLETEVIIAPKRHKEFDETLARLQKFRRLGILEPD
jgi:hypothetical protein